MMKKEVNGYLEDVYRCIPINDKTEIRVLTSECKSSDSLLVDVRKYSLYGNTFDNIKRPTTKGIKFKLHNIKDIIIGLIDVLIKHNMLERTIGNYIKDLINDNVRCDY